MERTVIRVIMSQAMEVQDPVLRCDLLHVGTGRVPSPRSWDVVANSFHEVIILLNSIRFSHQQG